MNIWEILQIEPTTDQRAIKKAYAKRAKEVHPEEKPEEFSQLYKAYQNALSYVKMEEQQEMEDYNPEIPVKNDSDVFNYFSEKQEELQVKLEAFQKQWDVITKLQSLFTAVDLERWVEYLKSEDFQEIRWKPQVLELLEQKMEKLNYALEPKLALWDAYGFKDEIGIDYHGDMLRLFEELRPAYERSKQKEREEQERLERIKAEKINADLMKTFFRIALVLFCVVVPIFVYLQLTAERRFVSTTMKVRYAADFFTQPEKTKLRTNEYTFYSKNHPEIKIEATVSENFKSEYILKEDYGLKLLQYFGEQYGLEFGFVEGQRSDTNYENFYSEYVLFYPDIENVDRVCDSFFKLLEEEGDGELSYLDSVGICWKNALYPESIVGGGAQNRPPVQIYTVAEFNDLEALKKSVKAAYVDYMYNYEAWNLTPEQQAAYGQAYVSKGRAARVEDGGNPWNSNSIIAEIEKEFDLYIPTYEKEIYVKGTDMPNAPYAMSDKIRQVMYITVGNAYQLLKAGGTAVNVKEDNSGFTATKDGLSSTFGDEPEQELSILKELLKEPESGIERWLNSQEIPPWMFEDLPEE